MATHTFDEPGFRLRFPAFSDPAAYPSPLLSAYFETATCYVDANDSRFIGGVCLQRALELMTAHLAQIGTAAASGDMSTGVVTAASIDKISVTQQVRQTASSWAAFLLRTPYGQQLDALLRAKAAGGFTFGGSRERAAIRKVGGRM